MHPFFRLTNRLSARRVLRPRFRRPTLESLERRAMLAGVTADPNTAWIKFDLSSLDKTGVTPAYDIYMQGYANSSGQILQYDASLDKLVLTKPLPMPVTFEPTSLTYVGTSPNAVTLATTGTLIVGAQVTATRADGTSFQSKVASITANATASSWNGSSWVAPGTSEWSVGAHAALQTPSVLATGTLTDGASTSTLTGVTVAQAATAGLALDVLAVGTIPGKPSNAYFFPATTDGRPFPKSGLPATVTSVVQVGSDLTATFSAPTKQGTVSLGTDFVSLFRGGSSPSGFATLSAFGPATATGVPVAVGSLLSTGQIVAANVSNPSAPQVNTYMVLSGVTGNVPIKSVESFTITLADPVPLDAGGKPVALTFATSVAAAVTSGTSFTIDATTYPGIVAALGIGQKPTLSVNGREVSNLAISGMQRSGNTITVTLAGGSMPWTSGPVTVALPPTGGPLPTYKWNASNPARNAIWAPQTETTDASPAINGARIYFSLAKPGSAPPAMEFSVADGVASVMQFDPAQIWQGQVAASQYIELTADSLGTSGLASTQGKVYVDLSAVDGFFFPAALSTAVGGKTLLLGQPAGPYQDPGNGPVPSFNAVARDEILNAWQAFFGATTKFAANADALRQAYAGLRIVSGGNPIGIQNPSFIWSMPSPSPATKNALNHAWDAHLNVLFSGTGTVDLMGDQTSLVRSFVNAVQVEHPGSGYLATDTVTFSAPAQGGRPAAGTIKVGAGGLLTGLTVTDPGTYGLTETPTIQIHSSKGAGGSFTVAAMVPAQTYYKGVPTLVTGHAALALAEYVGPPVALAQKNAWTLSYDASNATGAVFTVYDPRNPPSSEPQAFSPSGSAFDVGYQILANAGVFSSTGVNAGSYSHGAQDPWNGNASAQLTQLKALERDIVTALNQGIGGTLRDADAQPGPASTAEYWATETNWYPYPSVSGGTYPLATPQNLYSQWVHSAVIDESARKYYATYPFGVGNYGSPATNASGQLMNMTYGFGYDESPAHGFPGPSVPSKFLPIVNTVGNVNAPLTFQLVFGPWASADRPAVDLNGDGIGDTIWRKTDSTGTTVGYVGYLLDAQGAVVGKRGLAKGGDWTLETAAYFTTGPVTDFVWRNTTTNATWMWIMNADGIPAKQKYVGGKDSPEWQVETSGDYDGDGRTDLIWRNATNGKHSMWLMNEWRVIGQAVIDEPPTSRLVATAADYDANGDGCTDLIWRETTSDLYWVYLMKGTSKIGSFAVADGTGYDLVATGNYDSNGIGDLLWRDQSTGAVVQWLMTYDATKGSGKPRKETPISSGTTRAPVQSQSFWGNAITWRRPADGTYAVWKMLGSNATSKTPTIGGSPTLDLARRHPRPSS
jgi:hypothetical protein